MVPSSTDDFQKYRIVGMETETDAGKIQSLLAAQGYEFCEVDFVSSDLLVPLIYADSIEDIDDLLIRNGYDLVLD